MRLNKDYKYLTKAEEEETIIHILKILLDDSVPFSGPHRHKQWERGWQENYIESDLIPHYFGKYEIQRLRGRFIKALKPTYELEMLYSLVDALALKYLSKAQHIYEFGCGTGHNLIRLQDINPTAYLHGADWTHSSQRIIKMIDFQAHYFDFFQPDYTLNLEKDSAVYTVAALEQTGTDYKKFITYLRKKKPSIVVNIEPIPELLDPTKLIDFLSIKYMEKRKYLSGYLHYLRKLEKEGKVKIIEARRSGIGSFLIDGYSVITWKPI